MSIFNNSMIPHAARGGRRQNNCLRQGGHDLSPSLMHPGRGNKLASRYAGEWSLNFLYTYYVTSKRSDREAAAPFLQANGWRAANAVAPLLLHLRWSNALLGLPCTSVNPNLIYIMYQRSPSLSQRFGYMRLQAFAQGLRNCDVSQTLLRART